MTRDPGGRPRLVLVRYAVAAVPVRMVDAGAGVGLLLCAGARIADPSSAARTGGLLVAVFTLPHLLGPLLGRRVDLARDPRRLLGVAYAGVAVLLTAAVWALGRVPLPLVGVLVVIAGLGGPLLTGGLSSRLADLAGPGERDQRRAQGLDAATYGAAATLGPLLVAALGSRVPPVVAVTCLAALALVSAAALQTLPDLGRRESAAVPRVRDVLPLLLVEPRLRRVNYATMLVAGAQAGLAVVVVQLVGPYEVGASATALLLAAMGAGNVVASAVLGVLPLRGDADRLTTRHAALVAVGFGLCALAPGLGTGVAAFALLGVATAPFVTATFAARTAYAPPAARAQVFVMLAALKVTAASGGTAVAGLLVALGPRVLLLTGGSVVLLGAVATALDRRRSTGRTGPAGLSEPA